MGTLENVILEILYKIFLHFFFNSLEIVLKVTFGHHSSCAIHGQKKLFTCTVFDNIPNLTQYFTCDTVTTFTVYNITNIKSRIQYTVYAQPVKIF